MIDDAQDHAFRVSIGRLAAAVGIYGDPAAIAHAAVGKIGSLQSQIDDLRAEIRDLAAGHGDDCICEECCPDDWDQFDLDFHDDDCDCELCEDDDS